MGLPSNRNLSIFLVSSALGAGLAFSCSSSAVTRAEPVAKPNRAPASSVTCDPPAAKGRRDLRLRDPNYSYCAQFIDSSCKLGPFGETIRDLMPSAGFDAVIDTPPSDFATYCPNYAAFPREQKQRFWIWTLMALSYEESGCGEPSVVQAVRNYYKKYKGTKYASLAAADGPFALPYHKKDRDSRPLVCRDEQIVRDANLLVEPNFPGDLGKPVYLTPSKIGGMAASARCTMAMIAEQVKRNGKLVFNKNNYWQMLKKPGALTKRLAKFGGCTGKIEVAVPAAFGTEDVVEPPLVDTSQGN